VDSYPNYLTAAPVLGNRVGLAAQRAADAVAGCKPSALHGGARAGANVPVWVMETGYACLHDDECAPGSGCNRVANADFSESNQATFYEKAFKSTVGAGIAQGFIAFGAWPGPGVSPPGDPGYTSLDNKALELSSAVYLSPANGTAGAAEELVLWAVENAGYVASGRLEALVGNITNAWGTFAPPVGGVAKPLPAADKLKQLYATAMQNV